MTNRQQIMKPPGRLAQRLGAGEFAITAEVVPPVAAAPGELLSRAAPLRGLVDGLNVTDGARAKVHMSSLAAAAILAREGFEPVLQITCRDRNRIALAADLLGAGALGIRNVMVLRGDNPPDDIDPAPTPVFDMSTIDLVRTASRLTTEGRLESGAEVASPPTLLVGVADMPIDPPAGWKPDGLAAKADAGANFAQTQFCFDAEIARRYAERLGEHGLLDRISLILGIGPIASARSAHWMRENLFGTRIPDALVARLEAAADQKAEGIRICAELIDRFAGIPGVAGVHLMAPVGGPAPIAEAIRLSDLGARRTEAGGSASAGTT